MRIVQRGNGGETLAQLRRAVARADGDRNHGAASRGLSRARRRDAGERSGIRGARRLSNLRRDASRSARRAPEARAGEAAPSEQPHLRRSHEPHGIAMQPHEYPLGADDTPGHGRERPSRSAQMSFTMAKDAVRLLQDPLGVGRDWRVVENDRSVLTRRQQSWQPATDVESSTTMHRMPIRPRSQEFPEFVCSQRPPGLIRSNTDATYRMR